MTSPLTLIRPYDRAADTSIDSKLVQLEALRGLAAFIVVAWHFLWAFDPARIGIVDGFDPSSALLGSVSFASIDGPAAVTLFFVLSGFVLPLGFFRSGRTEVVVRATAKRWLRLVCLVLLAVLLSWVLFRCGLYRHREAALLSNSAWLGTFGGSHPPGFAPSLGGALGEGLLFAFVREPDMYDPVLWTMHHEFIGSFVTFFLAVMLFQARPLAAVWLLGTAAVVVHFADPYLFAFVAGTGLAWLVSRYDLQLSPVIAVLCITAGVFLFGYLEPRGSYSVFQSVQDASPARFDRIGIHTVSGLLIIIGLIGNDRLGRSLAAAPFRLLGRLSFPVYLFHFPLLCSIGCMLFVALRPGLPLHTTLLLIGAAYAPLVVGVGYALARVDEAWLHFVNRFAARLARPDTA
ncbi:MAG TPA: acyltransferase family protein [Acetobacteraceae bacterium]|nr:acyltransferase family protein [Acetobacteraceae bacterium]